MSDKIQDTIIRFAVIILVMIGMFSVVVGSIIHIQHSPAEKAKWGRIIANQVKTDQVIEPNRGNILDANGRLLASSLPQYIVHMDTRVEALHQNNGKRFYQHIDSISQGLSRIIGDKTPGEYRRMIEKAYHGKTVRQRDIRLHRGRISYIQKKEIEQLPLIREGVYKSGVYMDEQHLRKKPFGRLASRTIGSIYGETGVGNSGLEKGFESYLHGEEGVSTRQRIAGHWENVPVEEAVQGCDIITTLDANLLDICENELEKRLERTQADWGCCILMETQTGEVKAVCNLDRDKKTGSYYEARNHAVVRVEPGSTFKTISLMAALDDGKINIDDTVSVHRAGWDYGTSHHTDSHPRDTCYTAKSALAVSSNIAFAKIITRSYEKKAKKFVTKLQHMGLTDTLYSEIPGAQNPLIRIPDDNVTLSKMAYGYSVELSPMHIITFYNGIANGGKMIRPLLVKEIRREGRTIETFKTETLKSSMCSASTLRDVKSALHDVVWDNELGTASVLKWGGKVLLYKAQSELVHIAGKTGTAQLLVHGRYQSNAHRMTFVGYFPEEHPLYTCLCMIENPQNKGAYDAGMDCGTVVRNIAERTIAHTGVYEVKNGELIFMKK